VCIAGITRGSRPPRVRGAVAPGTMRTRSIFYRIRAGEAHANGLHWPVLEFSGGKHPVFVCSNEASGRALSNEPKKQTFLVQNKKKNARSSMKSIRALGQQIRHLPHIGEYWCVSGSLAYLRILYEQMA
jgi:hypothetical protein